MNSQQRKILKGALAAVVTALAFPPFVLIRGAGMTEGIGFGFILSWPQIHGDTGTVDVALLIAEWLGIGIVAAVLWTLNHEARSGSLIAGLIAVIRSRNDAQVEAARIQADAIIRAAEIRSARSALNQMKREP